MSVVHFSPSFLQTLSGVSPHAAGESEVEVEVVQRVVLLRGAGAGQGQAGDLAAQPKPPLEVQGAVVPGLFPSNKAGVVQGHVGDTGGTNDHHQSSGHRTTVASVTEINSTLAFKDTSCGCKLLN